MKQAKLFLLIFAIALIGIDAHAKSRKTTGVRGVEHVIIIGLDGLAGNLVEAAEMPTLKSMMESGSWTLQARSILPSSSACNWASMYMGVGPEMHGYNTWGSSKPDFPSITLGPNGIFPTIFTVLREQFPQMDMCVLYEWQVQGELIDKKAVNHHQHIPMSKGNDSDITKEFVNYIQTQKPDIAMCIYDSPDVEGHSYGWGSEPYMNRLKVLDTYIATIIEAARQAGIYDNTIFMIVADHGGTGKGHGGTSMKEMEAPLIFFGKGIREGYQIDVPVMRYDTAPTIARIFGATAPDVWRGRIIEEIFK